MKTLTTSAPAKINLYLDVTGKRPDGYHTLVSVMQACSLADTVRVTRLDSCDSTITVTCSDPAIPTDGSNIVVKCAQAFFAHFDICQYALSIDIEKQIPAQAGLGGGSSDGAATLRLLNELYDVHAPLGELLPLGAKIGADIPFCLVGGTCLCEGIGERITPIATPALPYSVVIAFPGDGVSTPTAFRQIDALPPDENRTSVEPVIRALTDGCLPNRCYNAFERVILPLHPQASALREKLAFLGAQTVLMSGSGPSVFGLFSDESCAVRAADALTKEGIPAFSCKPL